MKIELKSAIENSMSGYWGALVSLAVMECQRILEDCLLLSTVFVYLAYSPVVVVCGQYAIAEPMCLGRSVRSGLFWLPRWESQWLGASAVTITRTGQYSVATTHLWQVSVG